MARQGTGVFAKIRLSTPRFLFTVVFQKANWPRGFPGTIRCQLSVMHMLSLWPGLTARKPYQIPRTSHRYLVLCSKCIVIRIFKQTSTKVQCFPAKISFVQGEIDWHDFLQCNIGVMPIIKCVMFRRLNLSGSTRKGPTDNETVFFLVTCITRLPWAICEYH